VTVGIATIVILEVAVIAGHPPDAGSVLVTVYVPAVLPDKLITPVEELILSPAVEVNVPATAPPVNVGEGFVAI
jgi:hypothetical protein